MWKCLNVLFRWAVALLPLIGLLIHKEAHDVPVVWPPIGSIATYGAPAAVVIAGLLGLMPRFFKTKGKAKLAMAVGVFVALASLFVYGYLLSKYVVRVQTPYNGTQYRTIGSQRTPEALQMFSGYSDERILEIAGLNDADIERMWTTSSVRRARLELFICYVLCLASINFSLGSQERASS